MLVWWRAAGGVAAPDACRVVPDTEGPDPPSPPGRAGIRGESRRIGLRALEPHIGDQVLEGELVFGDVVGGVGQGSGLRLSIDRPGRAA